MCVYVYVCMHVYINICMCVYVCVYVCGMCVCMYVCMYVYIYIYIYIRPRGVGSGPTDSTTGPKFPVHQESPQLIRYVNCDQATKKFCFTAACLY